MPRSTTATKTTDPKQNIEEAYEKVEQAATDAVENIKEQAQEKLDASSDNIKAATAQAEKTIKERPLLSIGCAFLAGWAVSKLIK